MEIEAFATLVIPFIIVVYLGFLLFIHPPKATLVASLLAGLAMGVINALFDLLAYYAHWWHYTLAGLILHLPIPFYITPILIYGSIVYLLAWRFWTGRGHWAVVLLLVLVPIFRATTDIVGAVVTHTSYVQFDSALAAPLDVVMWLLMASAGWLVFRGLAPGASTTSRRVSRRGHRRAHLPQEPRSQQRDPAPAGDNRDALEQAGR